MLHTAEYPSENPNLIIPFSCLKPFSGRVSLEVDIGHRQQVVDLELDTKGTVGSSQGGRGVYEFGAGT